VLDHVFLDAVASLRQALDAALLERLRHEDRLAVDVLLGDLVWETSCSLPGEGVPPRVRADVTLEWPTWSQAAWRSWAIGEPGGEPPEIGLEVVLRVQRLADRPELDVVLAVLPEQGPDIGPERLERTGPIVEESYQTDLSGRELAVEVGYEGSYRLTEDNLGETKQLAEHLTTLGSWIASTLVRLGDLRLGYLPPEPETGRT
jgi:hypothetical protein